MNSSCCICLDDTICSVNCSTCNEGCICKSCHLRIQQDLDFDLFDTMNCPICRTPNIRDAFIRQFTDILYNEYFDEDELDKKQVLLILERNKPTEALPEPVKVPKTATIEERLALILAEEDDEDEDED